MPIARYPSECQESAENPPCRRFGDGTGALQELLHQAAPLLELELTASGAECGHPNAVQFDIQSYLLGALLGERRRLMTEIHRLATAYGWFLDEILSLSAVVKLRQRLATSCLCVGPREQMEWSLQPGLLRQEFFTKEIHRLLHGGGQNSERAGYYCQP